MWRHISHTLRRTPSFKCRQTDVGSNFQCHCLRPCPISLIVIRFLSSPINALRESLIRDTAEWLPPSISSGRPLSEIDVRTICPTLGPCHKGSYWTTRYKKGSPGDGFIWKVDGLCPSFSKIQFNFLATPVLLPSCIFSYCSCSGVMWTVFFAILPASLISKHYTACWYPLLDVATLFVSTKLCDSGRVVP